MRPRARILLGLGLGLGLCGAVPAAADPVVVELYSSQGCSSCPAADELFGALAEREDVIALALHVDYWDYIGWADTFARPEFTARQKAYARATGQHSIYTPQIIVDGGEQLVGARPMDLANAIARRQAEPESPVGLELMRDGDNLRIKAAATASHGPLLVELVRYRPAETVTIGHGENAGRTIDYRNVVTDWQVLGTWDGAQPLDMAVPAPGSEPAVVLLQEPGPGRILASARLP